MKKIFVVLFCLLSIFMLAGCEKNYNGDYVVIEDVNGNIVKGKDAMDAFYERTKNGEKLRLNYIKKYFEASEEKTYTFYIEYDGDYYITDYQMYTNSPKKTKYKYLVYSEEEGKEGSNIEKREYYCLANNESHTYQVVMNSWLSSWMNDHILDANPFYRYELYKDGFKLGSYSCDKSLDAYGSFPTITFQNSSKYCLFYSTISSVIDFGNYEIIDGYVYLIQKINSSSQENKETRFAFKIEDNKLILDLEKSTVNGWKFDDGTIFYYNDEYADDVKYKVNIIDNHGILIEPLDREYKPGEVVRVKLRFFSGVRAGINVNGELIEASTESVVWEYEIYEFIMPSEDVTLYTTINGYTESTKE